MIKKELCQLKKKFARQKYHLSKIDVGRFPKRHKDQYLRCKITQKKIKKLLLTVKTRKTSRAPRQSCIVCHHDGVVPDHSGSHFPRRHEDDVVVLNNSMTKADLQLMIMELEEEWFYMLFSEVGQSRAEDLAKEITAVLIRVLGAQNEKS